MYYRLHIKESEKMYEKYELQFNTLVMKQYPKEHKKYTLKATHRSTVQYLLRSYYAHLNNLRLTGQPEDVPFQISSSGIAEMKGSGRHTIIRQFNRLQNLTDDGEMTILNIDNRNKLLKQFKPFILEKKPSSTYFTVVVNSDFLVPEPTTEMTNWLVNNHPEIVKKAVKAGEYPLTEPVSISFFSPLKCAKCNTLAKQDTLENTNMQAEAIAQINALNLNRDKISCPQPIKNFIADLTPKNKKQGSINHSDLIAVQNEKNISCAENFENTPDQYGRKIERYIETSLHFIIMVLYNHCTPSGAYLTLTFQRIKSFFSNAVSYQTKLEELLQIVLLTKKYLEKHPEWEHPPIWVWLDPSNKGGITGAEKYYKEKIIPQRKMRKDYYENLHILAQSIREYIDKPGIETYRKCIKKIGTKQKGYLLDTFNRCVLDTSQYNAQTFQQLKKDILMDGGPK